jgi:acyl carrier protein
MSDPSIKERLLSCFQAVFPGLSDEALARLSADTHEGWDSVTQVTLMSVVDEEFGVNLPEDKYGEFTSFGSLLAHLEK